jgi:Dipeptidyl peptidase IV (DPP IV) N-terminal region
MNRRHLIFKSSLLVLLFLAPTISRAQGTTADYDRAFAMRNKYQGLGISIAERPSWIDQTSRFWYRKAVKGGNEFVLVNAETLVKKPAFDHEKLAAALSTASSQKLTALTLPFTSISFVYSERGVQFVAFGSTWRCDISDYSCKKTGTAPAGLPGRPPADDPPSEFENDVVDGVSDLSPQQGQRGQGSTERSSTDQKEASPDGKWEAIIQNFNVFIRPKGKREGVALSSDGSEGNYYTFASIAWSPDSKRLVAYRVRPGYRRQVHYVESSPADQLQPKHSTRDYAKPGDALDVAQPLLFEIEAKKQIVVDNALFPNPYSLSNSSWRKDSRAFTFEYNQRGHQAYRVLEVDAVSGKARALIDEEPQTFFSYRALTGNLRETGTRYRNDLSDGREIIWASERDGWRHLYLYDGMTGKLKNQITRGTWIVRAVNKVDEEKRQI